MKNILRIIVIILLVPILFVNAVILIDSAVNPNEVPSFFGWKPFIVLSESMETDIAVGDLVIVYEVKEEELDVGEIIAYRIEDTVITHRIVEINEASGIRQYITKGDNNDQNDEGYITMNNIEGLYQTKIVGLGNLGMFLQTPTGMVVALSIPILLLVLIQFYENKESLKYVKETTEKELELEEEVRKLKKEKEELLNKK